MTARAVVGVAFVLALGRALAFVAAHGVDLLVLDQWDFLVPLFDDGYGWLDKWRFQFSGSPHRMGAGWPVIEAVARATGWSTRADGFAIVAVLASAAALALVLKRRVVGPLEIWDAWIPLAFLSLRQWGTFVDTPDVALGAMPALLLVATAACLTLQRAEGRLVALLVLDAACVYTGFALFAGLLVPLLIAREGWLGHVGPGPAAAAFALSLALGASYLVGFDTTPAVAPIARDVAPGDYLVYVTHLFASALGARSSWTIGVVGLLWPVVLLAPLGWALLAARSRDAGVGPAAVALLAGFGLLFVLANTAGRIGEGIAFAFMPRYVTLLLPGLLGGFLAVQLALEGRARTVALATILVLWGAAEIALAPAVRDAAGALADQKRAWARCYLERHDLAGCSARTGLFVYPYESEWPRIERRLAWLEQRELNLFAPAARAAVAGSADAAAGTDSPPPRHVLLVSVDTLRADHLSFQGYERATTPGLDALAEQSVVFERAMSTAPWTLPAHGSLLTGRYPPEHGARDDGSALSSDVATLAERLRERGFDTMAVVSHVYVASPFGFDRGFRVFDDSLIDGGATNPRGDVVIERLLAHLDEREAGRPLFAFVHLYDPHWDYAAPDPYHRRFVSPRYAGDVDGSYASMTPFLAGEAVTAADREALVGYYDGEVAWVDAQLAALRRGLEERGLADDTLLIVTADHGEEFLDHGRLGHGRTLFEEQLHVPLLLHHRSLAPVRRREPVSLVDVVPTVLDALGLEREAGALPGRSLLRPIEADRVLFAESIRFGLEWRAARMGDLKVASLAEAGGPAFFDLASDPGERRPLAQDPSGGRLGRALGDFAARADAGWQLRIVAGPGRSVRFRARLESDGRLLEPRRLASQRVGEARVVFHRFEPSPDGRALELDVEAFQHTGSIRFEVDPPGAPVRIVRAEGPVFAADGRSLEGVSIELDRSDAGLAVPLRPARQLPDGIHVRASEPVDRPARREAAPLSSEARARLEALGYGEAGVAPFPDEADGERWKSCQPGCGP